MWTNTAMRLHHTRDLLQGVKPHAVRAPHHDRSPCIGSIRFAAEGRLHDSLGAGSRVHAGVVLGTRIESVAAAVAEDIDDGRVGTLERADSKDSCCCAREGAVLCNKLLYLEERCTSSQAAAVNTIADDNTCVADAA